MTDRALLRLLCLFPQFFPAAPLHISLPYRCTISAYPPCHLDYIIRFLFTALFLHAIHLAPESVGVSLPVFIALVDIFLFLFFPFRIGSFDPFFPSLYSPTSLPQRLFCFPTLFFSSFTSRFLVFFTHPPVSFFSTPNILWLTRRHIFVQDSTKSVRVPVLLVLSILKRGSFKTVSKYRTQTSYFLQYLFHFFFSFILSCIEILQQEF